MRRANGLWMVVTVATSCLWATAAAAATPCEAMSSRAIAGGAITRARVVAAGALTVPGPPATPQTQALYARLPELCRASLTMTPTVDSEIRVEVWLPAAEWNGKFQAVGNGGFAGVISYPAMARAVLDGYATASTDTGHVGNSADFIPGHHEKLVDFAYRAVHEMTVAAKHVIDLHYGRAPQFSYFNGCSQGGRQAITSAQRYPADFDGIVAGAAAWDTMRSHAARLALNFAVNRTPASVIPPAKYPAVHAFVMNACDRLDGVKDGVIEDPTRCRVDFARLACKGADGPSCLTPSQVASAKAMTTPLTKPGTSEVVFPGYLPAGTELEWDVLGGPQPLRFAQSAIANLVYGDKAWSDRSFDAVAELARVDAADRGVLKSNDANLAPFFSRGGKLLMYHGWADPQVPPQLSVVYYDNVLKAVGPKAEQSLALFMMPGMYHCAGGPGPDTFDRMGAIESWVEKGEKPARIVASHRTDGKTDRTRPLCPYPQVAAYSGKGSTDDAASFICKVPAGAAGR
jgi:feruloyl esterase